MNTGQNKIIEIDLLVFKIRGRQNPMHNITIIIGLLVCMTAGSITVVQGIMPGEKFKTYRLFRTARRAGRKGKEYLSEIWN